MERLAKFSSCIRTYSAGGPQSRVSRIAAQHGMKVLQGIWLARNLAANRREIDSAIRIARLNPGKIEAFVVGNEVSLRGELPPAKIADYLKEVKRRSGLPVTYADVWEFWLRLAELAPDVDFLTIHILPYWEDMPVAAKDAASYVRDIRAEVAKRFEGKEILIGEVGWPSHGRMREAALPSPSNQVRALERHRRRGQGGKLEGELHRGLRPAVEAAAGRNRRRLLGAVRRTRAGTEIPLRRAHLQLPALAASSRARYRRGVDRLRIRLARTPGQSQRGLETRHGHNRHRARHRSTASGSPW